MAQASIHANTGFLNQFAGQLDPSAIRTAKAAAAEVQGSVKDCGDVLPGCQQFNSAVREVTAQFTAFFTEVEQGFEAYAGIARGSAADYVNRDGTGRAAIQAALGSGPASGR